MLTSKDWFNIWREFAIEYKRSVKSGKPYSWRKQQRMIHRLVDGRIAAKATGQPIAKRGPGRPRKHPLIVATPGMGGNVPAQSVPVPTPANVNPGVVA